MKIIFVGIHNKSGMKPLDSKSKSGKLIDAIINQLPNECLKTNFFDLDNLPNQQTWGRLSNEWYDRINPDYDDIIVLLGAITHKAWDISYYNKRFKTVKIGHPSAVWSAEKKIWYVQNGLLKINRAKLSKSER